MTTRDPDQQRAPSLREYLRVLRTYWTGSLAIVLLTVSAAAAWTIGQTRIYNSVASGIVQSTTGDDLGLAFAGDSLAKSRAESYVELANSVEIAGLVGKSLSLSASPSAILAQVSASLPTGTAIIRVSANAATPSAAKELADAWISALTERVAELEEPDGAGARAATRFTPLASAPLSSRPSSPDVPVALVVALVIGTFVAALYAAIRNQFDRGVRSAAMIEERFGVSVVGTVPRTEELEADSHVLGHQRPVAAVNQATGALEALRELRTNLSYVDVDNPPRVLLVTSSMPAEGKSTLAANLAATIARSGQPVVVVDADLRHPSQGRIFGLPDGAGLSDVLAGRVALGDVLQDPGAAANLRVLAAGRTPPNPSELLGSRTMRELLAALSELAVVIVDAPPLLPVTDAAVLSKSVDGTLLVVAAKTTKVDQLGKALRSLEQVSARLTGVVLNRVPRRGVDAASYGYYGSEYGYYAENSLEATTGAGADDRADTEGATQPTGPAPTPSAENLKELWDERRDEVPVPVGIRRGDSPDAVTVADSRTQMDRPGVRGRRARRDDEGGR